MNQQAQPDQMPVSLPFTTTFGMMIGQIKDQVPFSPDSKAVVTSVTCAGQFLRINTWDKPLHVCRFNLTKAQEEFVKGEGERQRKERISSA